MKKIFRVSDNPFDDVEISRARLADFATDAARRLAAEFPAESNAIEQAATVLTGERSNLQQSAQDRSSDTAKLDAFLASVAEFMRKAQARIVVDLGEDSPEFAKLYPDGQRTYARLSKADAPAHLLTVKQTIEGTGDRLHEPTRRRLLAFHDEWKALRHDQQESKSSVSEAFDDGAAARAALEDALYEALLQVSRKYKRQPEAARRFFDHTLLDAARHAPHTQATS
ncbi:MAG: hypothetical protein EOP50_09330 [Sphingobacteriales bacterium]|nr:MAG: hypothetical protein EOP50_09330 [Sphingobacteriales bacterium]